MAEQTKIYLVRHGESVFNKLAIIGGHADPTLTDEGREQVRLAKLELKDVHFDTAYSSDLQRAIQTGEIIYGKSISPTNQLYGLRERNFGSLDGKPEEHLKQGNEEKATLSHEKKWTHKHVPDMESDHELTLRFIPALEEVAKKNRDKTILVVAHGGAIRTTIMRLAELTYDELPPGSFKNAGYVELTYGDDGLKVVRISGLKI